jgi:hypothetical protein
MDGRVNLGKYGSVYVAGLTIDEATNALKQKLSSQVDKPKVAVDVLKYNSKVYYVILDGRGLGDHVERVRITGNDTVLDAIAALGSIPKPESMALTLTRPAPNGVGPDKVFHVDWQALGEKGAASANYQIFPGDRLFIRRKTSGVPAPAPSSNFQSVTDGVDEAITQAEWEEEASRRSAPPKAEPPPALPDYFMFVRPQLEAQQQDATK